MELMKKTKVTAVLFLLAFCLFFNGCAKKASESTGAGDVSADESQNSAGNEDAAGSEGSSGDGGSAGSEDSDGDGDAVGSEDSAGNADSVWSEYVAGSDKVIMMMVGNESVTREEVLFYIYHLKSKYEDSLGNDIWSLDIGGGQKLGEYALEETKSHIKEIKIICQAAKKQGVTLLDEEKEDAGMKAEKYMSEISPEDGREYGITKELVEKIYMENMLASKMYDVTTADVNADISDEDSRCADIQYIEVMTHGTTKEGVEINLTEEEEKDAYKRAQNLLKEAKKADDFKSFAQINTDASSTDLTVCKGDGPEDIESAALALKTGDFSTVVEGKEGYYIIYCVSEADEDATMEKKEEMITHAQDEKFMEEYEKWSEDYQVVVSSTEWENLKF